MHHDLIQICETWKETKMFQNQVSMTQTNLKKTFSRERSISISYSGGKDSLVLTHLAAQINAQVFVWHWDYGIFMPRLFEQEILTNLNIIAPNARKIIDKRLSKETSSQIGYRAFFQAIHAYTKEHKISLILIGLRKEESKTRKARLHFTSSEQFNRTTKNMFPLAEWKWQDIWTYIYIHNLPYPQVYDLYGPLIGWQQARFVTFFDPEFDHLGNRNLDRFLLFNLEHDNVKNVIISDGGLTD